MYGDAYVFQAKREPIVGGTTRYHDLGQDFIAAVGEGKFPKVILKCLLDQLEKEGSSGVPTVVQEDIED